MQIPVFTALKPERLRAGIALLEKSLKEDQLSKARPVLRLPIQRKSRAVAAPIH